jgi:proton glutamate symport protein
MRFKNPSLTQWILIAMGLGILLGALCPEQAAHLKVLSNIFLRLIKCMLVPLVFGTLVVGIASHSQDLRAVGRLALKSLLYFEVVTSLALVVGLAVVNLAQPGAGISLPPPDPHAAPPPSAKVSFSGILEHTVPKSFFEAAASNDVLQVVCFAVLFAAALAQVKPPHHGAMLGFCEALTETMFKFVGLVMRFAPVGIGAAMAATVAHSGLGVLIQLAKLILTLYAALAVFCILVLLPIALWAKIPVLNFLRTIRSPAALAFTTTSSDAALPDAMQRMIGFGVPKRIVSFVMPLGYSFNLDGSTLYLAVATVFVAQAAQVHLSLTQQLAILFTLMLTSKGMAGIPRASQVILAGTLLTFGLPLEGVLLIVGVDELMDMARTTVNLVGNCLATAVIARWEGEFNSQQAAIPCADSVAP